MEFVSPKFGNAMVRMTVWMNPMKTTVLNTIWASKSKRKLENSLGEPTLTERVKLLKNIASFL